MTKEEELEEALRKCTKCCAPVYDYWFCESCTKSIKKHLLKENPSPSSQFPIPYADLGFKDD